MKIGLMGLGTVGMGVYELLNRNKLYEISYVLVKNKKKSRPLVNMDLITDDPYDLDDVDILVEVTGDYDLAYSMIKRHLLLGHHVVTANKEVMAPNLLELSNLAKENNCYLLYEASCGGGIPIISNLFKSKQINDFNYIMGILNGTTNFILTKLFTTNMKLDEAIGEAIRLGFAEADPSNDLKGLDMARKMAILSKIAYGVDFDLREITCFGLNNITDADVSFLKNHHLSLKFVAESKYGDISYINVNPIAFHNHSLASVNNEFNSILLGGSVSGDLIFTGKGAGAYPTAYAIIDDLFKIYNNEKKIYFEKPKKINLGLDHEMYQYYVRTKDSQYITPYISKEEFFKLDCEFYAIIKEGN